ncbi:DUF5592 family protein [uncultured Clostridium sp.]|uniref:DUF5592 family protein n=1 Tax=uncultured Clostridium sp. TaxID=59620 RepID=UPI0025DF3790|nr:DUF5592 family protein [uncultured Clostridium sp.]
MKFIIPTELDVKMSANRFPITFVDLGIIFGFFLLAFLLRVLVYIKLQIPFLIFVVVTTTILVLESADNKGKKVYHSIMLALKEEKNIFYRLYFQEKLEREI